MGAHGMHVHPSDDVTIDYFAAGEGPAIVLVHGITESRRTWDPLFPLFLQAGYRVIYFSNQKVIHETAAVLAAIATHLAPPGS